MVLPAAPGHPAQPETGGHTLDALCHTWAERTPDRVAVTAPDAELTYRRLSEGARRVAHALDAAGVRPGSLVGLVGGRTAATVTALLGILTAGAAYVPVDPASPAARVAQLLDDSAVTLVVAESAHADAVPAGIPTILVEKALDTPAPPPAPRRGRGPGDLAYAIYTSGTSGQPKGVLVEHRNVLRLFSTTRETFLFTADDVWTLFHSVAFDFSVWEIWGALLHGGRLVVVPQETARSPLLLRRLLSDERVTVLSQTPSAFRQLATAEEEFPDLRLVVFGGERLDPALLRPWTARRGDEAPVLVNMYGITETTVHASLRRIRTGDCAADGGPSPIGHPLPDLRFHLLDADGAPVADGDPGEIHIAGPGVARGYHRRPALTAERFVTLLSVAPDRLYRSGDLAALRDGEYVYLGRTDDQVKVRGFRIEPGEIEAVVRARPGVGDCVVLPRDYGGGDVRLVAFVVPSPPVADPAGWIRAGTRDLRAAAAAALPEHMRPSTYVAVASVPLTPNGKTDKERLLTMAATGSEPGTAKVTRTQAEVTRIWCEVLDVDAVGAEDDFFDLGGTSLALVRMMTAVNEHFKTDLDVSALASGATVANLAARIDAPDA